jgi:hypothetical protein
MDALGPSDAEMRAVGARRGGIEAIMGDAL